jgi:small subunit ribosomal protein S7
MKPFFILNPFVRNLIGLKWIVEFSLKKSGVLLDNLIFEILEAFENKGSSKKKQQDLNLVVLQNKSNLRFRW